MGQTIKATIVEDDLYFLQYFKTMLNKINNLNVTKVFANGNDFLNNLNSGCMYDVIFLDIALPDITGNEIGRRIRERSPNAQIVFVTGDTSYATEAFDLEACDYLVKPFDFVRLERCLNRVASRMDFLKQKSKQYIYIIQNVNYKKYIYAKDIIFIEKINKKVVFHTPENHYECNDCLREVEKRLLSEGFVRSHRSYLINPKHINSIERWGDRAYQISFNGTDKKALLSRTGAELLKLKIGKNTCKVIVSK